MKKLIVMSLLSLAFAGCSDAKKQNENSSKLMAVLDSSSVPKTDIRVNKKYDSKGNLLQYDSSYSYFYFSPGFKNSISSDSLFYNFKTPLRNDYKDLLEENMNSVFFNDSLFKYDFYNSDYFSERFRLNMLRFENMFRQMDSLKSNMFRKKYPEGTLKRNWICYFKIKGYLSILVINNKSSSNFEEPLLFVLSITSLSNMEQIKNI